MTPYDHVLYPSYSHSQTHPDNLAVVGKLFGMEPTAVTKCRVLELGCGNGSNLAPMAWALPGSEFVGIDLAEVPIRHAAEMVSELGLKNARFVAADLLEVDDSWGKFDYILAHGLYSWVPAEVRDQVMKICRALLSSNGIAFISYNALPGGHLRQMLREMMLFHVRQVEAPEERLQQAMAFLSFLEQAHVDQKDEYAVWLNKEWERARNLDRSHVFHDDLATFNHPVYFHQFMGHAVQHGLQFVGEADFFEMSDHIFAPNIREVLRGTAHDRILREQYLDFLKCRRFRQTLLCHQEVKLQANPDPKAIAGFYVSSRAKQEKKGAKSGAADSVEYSTPKGARVETDHPGGRVMLKVLEEIAPAALSVPDLLRVTQERMPAGAPGISTDDACAFLLQLYSAGVLEFRTRPAAGVQKPGDAPEASPIARWQIERGMTVTTLHHQVLQVEDEIGRQLIRTLDGKRSRKELASELIAFLRGRGVLGAGSESEIRERIEKELAANLDKLARLGLLVA